jgi:hypothetical protein
VARDVYGRWFLIAFGFGLVVLFVIGMIATAYAPIFAVGIALVIAVFLVAGMAMRRGSQVGSERTAAAQERLEDGHSARPTASSSPRGGEGETGRAHRAPVTGGGRA